MRILEYVLVVVVLSFVGCTHRETQEVPLSPKNSPEWVKSTKTFWTSKHGDTLYFKGMALRVLASNVNAVIDAAEADAKRSVAQTFAVEISTSMKEKSNLKSMQIQRWVKEFIDKTYFPFYRVKVYTTYKKSGYITTYSAWVLMGITRDEFELYKQRAATYVDEKLNGSQ